MPFPPDRRLLDEPGLAASAGATILRARATLTWRMKADRSPVTNADEAAEAIILEALPRLLPGVPIISEESAQESVHRPAAPASVYLLVDPLDGTRDFLDGTADFAVNIALVADGMPVLGVIAAPALGRLWRGGQGLGAERLAMSAVGKAEGPAPIRTRPAPAALVAAISRSHPDAATLALIDTLPLAERRRIGSAVKFGYLAEGTVDVYPRLSPTSEWDIAAGHALVAAAGGVMTAPDGTPLRYGESPSFRVAGFIAWGDPAMSSPPGRRRA